jgi:hypothetical protein
MGETASRARKHIQNPAKAKTVTVVEGKEGDAGAVFDLAPKSRLGVGPVSSKRWGDGGRKIGADKQPNLRAPAVVLILPGVCGKLARAGVFGFSRPGQLFAVSVKCGGAVSPVEKRSGVAERSGP